MHAIKAINNFCSIISPLIKKPVSMLKLKKQPSCDIFEKKSQSIGNYLKAHALKPKDVEKILEVYPETSRYIGSLPNQWINFLPKDEIAPKSKEVFEAFSKFARKTYIKHCPREVFDKQAGKLKKKLVKILNLKEEQVSVYYYKSGSVGNTFKIRVENEDYTNNFYILKVFKEGATKNFYENSLHWKGSEVLNAAYAQKNSPKGNFAKFYFGKFARMSDKDGFLVTEFISDYNAKQIHMKNPVINLLRNNFVAMDAHSKNNIKDTILDFGGLLLDNSKLTTDEKKVFRFILEALDDKNPKRLEEILSKHKDSSLLKKVRQSYNDSLKECNNTPESWRFKIGNSPYFLSWQEMNEIVCESYDSQASWQITYNDSINQILKKHGFVKMPYLTIENS